MENDTFTYTVQQVSQMVGISKQLIRKWEDRYEIISPRRLDNGYRVYTQKEIDILLQMKQLTDSGHAPMQAAEIVKATKQAKKAAPNYSILTNPVAPYTVQSSDLTRPTSIQQQGQYYIEQLIAHGENGDDVEIVHVLKQAQMTMGVESLLNQVVSPFLHLVGDLWCERLWGEYQEAMASLAVRDFLVGLRRTLTIPDDAPLILGSCLPGERHEIPMHILLIKCMLLGYRTVMLGQSPAPSAIQASVKLKKPKFVLLTASTNTPFEQHLQEIKELDQFAAVNPHVRFYLGGTGAFAAQQKDNLQNITLAHDLNSILKKV